MESFTDREINLLWAGRGSADGLSYALVGNRSLALYYVVARAYIIRIPVAWVAAGTPPPPVPFPPPPPSPLNPKACRRFKVAGAGLAGVNGLYKQESSLLGAPPTFTKDGTHQLCVLRAN